MINKFQLWFSPLICGSKIFQDYFVDAKESRVKQIPKIQESSFMNQDSRFMNQVSRIKILEQSRSRFKNQEKTQSR